MTFNKISRLPVIGDLAGVYFVYNTDTPIINGVYVKSTNESAAIKMGDVTETLNGSNYVMVYGTGTPEENAAELQAAYNAAKKMPRYLGIIPINSVATVYKGQSYVIGGPNVPLLATADYTGIIQNQPLEDRKNITLDIAKSIRTTVIVAPGEYDFGATAFVVDSSGIDITSLTGNSDIIISNVSVNSDFLKLSGVNGRIYFTTDVPITNVVIEKCVDLDNYGFAMMASELFNVKFIDCISGDYGFVADELSERTVCEFWRCNGGGNSFSNQGDSSFYYCTSGAGSSIGAGNYVFFCVENLTALPNS